jgi:hypothetical protein
MLVLVVIAGCDNLLRLDDIKPPRDGSGSDGDGAMVDASCQVVHCAPTSFAGGMESQFSSSGLGGLALSPGIAGEYVLVNQKVDYAPTFGNALQPTTVSGVWARIALSPDGHELYLGGLTGMYIATWGGTAWGQPLGVADFPSDGALATPAQTCGELRMMVTRNGAFEEWTRVGGAWQSSRQTPLSGAALTGTAMPISHPSLSNDGLVLVFAAAGTTLTAGVWAASRNSIGEAFQTPAVQILSFTTVVTPFLSEDCHDLYYEGGSAALYHWSH